MKWEDLEQRLRSVSTDKVEASLFYYGLDAMDEPWSFRLSDCPGRGMVTQPTGDMVTLDREQMTKLRDFLVELLGPAPVGSGHDAARSYVDSSENQA